MRHKLVRDRDKALNSDYQLQVTDRPTERKLICLSCRRSPDREAYRVRWLADHPLPQQYCPKGCYAKTTFATETEHKDWHLYLYVSANMPAFEAFSLAFTCPDCQGKLVSVTL